MKYKEKICEVDNLKFDLRNLKLHFQGVEKDLGCTRVSKLVTAAKAGKVNINEITVSEDTIMYVSCRNILSRKIGLKDTYVYMDVLLYNSALATFGNGMYNRSLGHVNDVNEFEIHQVLKGKVLVVLFNEVDVYWGIFKAGEYFEIPSNWFHCTYVLEDYTMVANFYGDAFWNDEISKKPYFSKCNPYNVCQSNEVNEYIIFEKGKEKIKVNEGGMNLTYGNIPEGLLTISSKHELKDSIFELFYLV